jgi:hypothetical protein
LIVGFIISNVAVSSEKNVFCRPDLVSEFRFGTR